MRIFLSQRSFQQLPTLTLTLGPIQETWKFRQLVQTNWMCNWSKESSHPSSLLQPEACPKNHTFDLQKVCLAHSWQEQAAILNYHRVDSLHCPICPYSHVVGVYPRKQIPLPCITRNIFESCSKPRPTSKVYISIIAKHLTNYGIPWLISNIAQCLHESVRLLLNDVISRSRSVSGA